MNWLQFKIRVYEKLAEPYFIWPLRARSQRKYVKSLRNKDYIKVVFYAMNLSMWNYQHLYDLMKQNPRFKLFIIISPDYNNPTQLRIEESIKLKDFFINHHIDFIDCNDKGEVCIDVRNTINPDIIFYPQPYFPQYNKNDICTVYKDRLICYYPYAFWTANGNWSYNLTLHNIAWKLFYSTEIHRKYARIYSANQGRNVVVTGYPKTDDYLRGEHQDVWKIKDRKYKRLIWAPHFTLKASLKGTVARSNFLMMADMMIDLAKKYPEKIQIAFKPHPRLKTELYRHQDWGKERTDNYFKEWNSMPNTFIADGEYIDLFMTSDGMVHDCSSFSVEYLYSQNPVMYVSEDIDSYKNMLNDFGKEAIDVHYIGKNNDDVISFVENQVIDGIDPMKGLRKSFFLNYLVPSHGMSVAEYTYHNILSSLDI